MIMYNLIEELKKFVNEYTNNKDKYSMVYEDEEIRIKYKQAEFIVEQVEELETTCDSIMKSISLYEDYNRLLRKENEELKQYKGE